jgi:hypothetical protein
MPTAEASSSPGTSSPLHRVKRRLLWKPAFADVYVIRYRGVLDHPEYKPPADLEIREARAVDDAVVSALADMHFYTNTPDQVRTYLDAGQRCFVALRDDKVLGCLWLAGGIYDDSYFQRKLYFEDHEVYLLGAYTFPEHRGEGILDSIIEESVRLCSLDVPETVLVALIRAKNAAVFRVAAKLDFHVDGHLWVVDLPLGVRAQLFSKGAGLSKRNRRFIVRIARN